jgi:hypothetical protein
MSLGPFRLDRAVLYGAAGRPVPGSAEAPA